jgi:SAM-dependent methyltransferase
MASFSPASAPPPLFDRVLLRRRRERAALRFDSVNVLKKEAAARLAERVEDVAWRRFPLALDLGAHNGECACALHESGRVDHLVTTDLAHSFLRRGEGMRLVCDEEAPPFRPASFDLIVSALSLHWVNDLPGTLTHLRRLLRPGGLFLATLPGPQTLRELREALTEAELFCHGGAGLRIAPFVEVRDAGNLLVRAGFAAPVADSEFLTLTYPDFFSLLREIRAMGESNALVRRTHAGLTREVLLHAAALYEQRYAEPDGTLRATVEFITLTGWQREAS